MVNLCLTLVLLLLQQFLELAAVAVHVGKVEGSEVLVEGHVGEVVVDVEKEGVGDVGGWLRV